MPARNRVAGTSASAIALALVLTAAAASPATAGTASTAGTITVSAAAPAVSAGIATAPAPVIPAVDLGAGRQATIPAAVDGAGAALTGDATAGTASAHPSALAAQHYADELAAYAEANPFPPSARARAEHTLRSLPGGSGIEIAWDHPDIGNHLGGVWIDRPETMMLNHSRFEAEPERIESTIKHEIAHVYQGRIIAEHARGSGSWEASYWRMHDAMVPVFGQAWMERSADCVALRLGATWTHYTSACDSAGAQAAVDALLDGRMP